MPKIALLLIPIAVLYIVATIYVIIKIFIFGHYIYGVILIAAFIFSLLFICEPLTYYIFIFYHKNDMVANFIL